MRLTPDEVRAIKDSAREAFGENAVVRLFGSRLNDAVRGGDIDLHLEVDRGQEDVATAARFRWKAYERIGERKLDLIFHVRGKPLRSIDKVALAKGVIL